MQRNAHYPPALSSFPIKRVELVTKHLAVFGGSMIATHEYTDIVQSLVVRYHQHSPPAHAHRGGLVIAHPVTDILEALRCQQIRCVKAFCERRPQPSLRSLPDRLGKRVPDLPDHFDLLIFRVASEAKIVCHTV